MWCTFAAICYIATVSISTRIGALNITDAITGCPLNERECHSQYNQSPPRFQVKREPKRVRGASLAEHLANGVGIAPKIFQYRKLASSRFFCRQQQVLT